MPLVDRKLHKLTTLFFEECPDAPCEGSAVLSKLAGENIKPPFFLRYYEKKWGLYSDLNFKSCHKKRSLISVKNGKDPISWGFLGHLMK